MNKMKRALIKKIVRNNKITSKEFDLLFLLCGKQNENGTVENVYYRDICSELECSKATFYNIINGLSDKGFVKKQPKTSPREDFNIILLDNDFSNDLVAIENDDDGNITKWKTLYRDYVETDYSFLYEKKFHDMPVGAKRMALYYLNIYHSKEFKDIRKMWQPKHHLKRDKNGLSTILGVKPRSILHYYEILDDYIHLESNKFCSGNGHYEAGKRDIVYIRKSFTGKVKRSFTERNVVKQKKIPVNFFADEHRVKTFCRKQKIGFDKLSLNDVTGFFNQYRKLFDCKVEEINACEQIPIDKKITVSLWDVLKECILDASSLELIPATVHSFLKERIASMNLSSYLKKYA